MEKINSDQEKHAVQIVTGICLVIAILLMAGVPVLVSSLQF